METPKIIKNNWYSFTWKKKKYFGKVQYISKNPQNNEILIVANDFRQWHLWPSDINARLSKKQVREFILNGVFSI